MYKHVIFDIDGTLIDTRSCTILSLQMLVSDKNMSLSEEDYPHFCSMTTEQTLRKLGYGDDWRDACARWHDLYNSLKHTQTLFDGIEDLLKALHSRNLALSVVTSRTRSELIGDGNFDKLAHYFSDIITAEMTLCHKPHPDPLLMCVERSGYPANNTLYIGDSITDLQCARDAGIDFLLATWSNSGDMNISCDTIEHPMELIDMV